MTDFVSAPPSTATRHGFVDALRGFALLGILLVNIEFIVQTLELGWSDAESGTDQVVRWLVTALGQTKIYPLFALLFGYGISLQMSNAARRGTDFGPRYRRRIISIGALGVLHGILFFPGDVLVIYAIVGAIAYRFRDAEAPRLVRIGAVVYAVAAAVWLVLGLLDLTASPGAATVDADVIDTFTNGSYLEVIALQFENWIGVLLVLGVIQGPAVFAFFLVGIALGRTDLLARPDEHRGLAVRVLRWAPVGLVLAGIGATMTVAGGRWDTIGFAIGFASAPLVAAGYLAGLSLLIGRGGSLASRALEAPGRMSLTVYLGQSVIVSTLAYGYGFGLFGRVGPLAGVLLAVVVWAALGVFSVVWLRFARFGPLEWVLRSVTYGKRQPLWKQPTTAQRR